MYSTLHSSVCAHSKLHSVLASLPKIDKTKLFHKICFHKESQELLAPWGEGYWCLLGNILHSNFREAYCLIWGVGATPDRQFIFCLCHLHAPSEPYKNHTALKCSVYLSASLNSATKKLPLRVKTLNIKNQNNT